MQNRALALAARPIPYIKELRSIAGGVTSAILMQQLDHWFNTYPDGFYKFLSPCDKPLCKPGQSWTEELGFSEDEFRTAFDRIGVRHGSKGAYDAAENPFVGKTAAGKTVELYYASYHDKIRGLTYYFRNHTRLDAKITELMAGKPRLRNQASPGYVDGQVPATETSKSQLRNRTSPSYVTGRSPVTELDKSQVEYKETEKTSEKTSEKTPETPGGESANPLLPLLIERYKNIVRSQKDTTNLQWQAEDLRSASVTVEELTAWLAWRKVSPAIPFIAERFLIWREDQRAERERRQVEAMVGLDRNLPAASVVARPATERELRTGVYGEVLEILAEYLPQPAIATWFDPLEEQRIEDGILYLTTEEPRLAAICRDFIQSNYGKEVETVLERVGLSGLMIGEPEAFAEAA